MTPPRPSPPIDFYGPAFAAELRRLFEAARQVQGLSEEIALLRLRVRRLILSDAGDQEIQKAVDAVVKAVTASGRLPLEDAGDALGRVSEELGGILELLAELPPEAV